MRIIILIFSPFLLSGCIGSESDDTTPVIPSLSISSTIVIPIEPGERPREIDGATYITVCKFLNVEAVHVHENWICLEGIVDQVGERLGASYIVLKSDLCNDRITLEASPLQKYQIPIEKNVIIRGYIKKAVTLSDISFVTQEEIDTALKNETGIETTSEDVN